MSAAQLLAQRGQPVEAAQFVRVASRIHPQAAGHRVARAAQLGGGLRAVAGFGTYGARSLLGVSARSSADFSVLPLSVGALAEGTASAAGVRSGAQLLQGLQQPTDLYDQEFDDDWSIGAEGTFGLVGVVLGLHLLQVGDFVARIVGVDFLRDDFAHTRGLQLGAEQSELLERLGSMERSSQTMQAYRSLRPPSVPPAANRPARDREPVRRRGRAPAPGRYSSS